MPLPPLKPQESILTFDFLDGIEGPDIVVEKLETKQSENEKLPNKKLCLAQAKKEYASIENSISTLLIVPPIGCVALLALKGLVKAKAEEKYQQEVMMQKTNRYTCLLEKNRLEQQLQHQQELNLEHLELERLEEALGPLDLSQIELEVERFELGQLDPAVVEQVRLGLEQLELRQLEEALGPLDLKRLEQDLQRFELKQLEDAHKSKCLRDEAIKEVDKLLASLKELDL
jgi:hypothetical protein